MTLSIKKRPPAGARAAHRALVFAVLALTLNAITAGCNQTSKGIRGAGPDSSTTASLGTVKVSAEEARNIASEAYIYLFPMVENYLTMYQFAFDPNSDQYKGPANQVHNVSRVFTPADTGIVTPNSDTPYSFLIMDLRAEPMVVTLPKIEKGRYYSLQLVDLYSHNVDYLGTNRDGNDGGDFLIAGPGWDGNTPKGIKRVVRIPTQLMFSQFRTQLLAPDDIENVKKIQAGYRAQPLSSYLNTSPPHAVPVLDFPAISRATAEPEFWEYANFLLQFAPPLPGEEGLRERMERIGVIGGQPWPPQDVKPDVLAAVEAGQRKARQVLDKEIVEIKSSVGLFGSPDVMKGKYRERALGALGGLYGLTPEEAYYSAYMLDTAGQRFDTSKQNYTLTFAQDQMPPVNAFWSLTMYDGITRFLIDNPLDRYLINSPMLPALKKNPDGAVTLYIQHESPGKALESNWLPAPDGPMSMMMRLYLPKNEVIQGQWKAPVVQVNGKRAG